MLLYSALLAARADAPLFAQWHGHMDLFEQMSDDNSLELSCAHHQHTCQAVEDCRDGHASGISAVVLLGHLNFSLHFPS
jgi:hypothetical protein